MNSEDDLLKDIENIIDSLEITITQGPGGSRDQPCKPGSFYVYVHKDSEGKVFYVGYGTGRSAWSRDRDNAWSAYVAQRGDKYEVEIVRDGISKEDALQVKEAVMAEYAATVLNRQN